MQSLLLTCLFFGLISMILPLTGKTEWIYLLLLLVVASSLISTLFREVEFGEIDSRQSVEYDVSAPSSAALNLAVSSQVRQLTGEVPISVENDLSLVGEEYRLTQITVVLQAGDEKEVQYALEKAFSFPGFTVVTQDP